MESIRILSYNIFLRPPPIHDRSLSDYKDERTLLIGKEVIPNYDIISFEEAFGSMNSRRDQLIEYGKKNGLLYHNESPNQSFCNLKVDGGLLFLSRYPIVEKGHLEYPRGCHGDWWSMKGALYNRLKIGDKHINVFTTHLQASYEEIPPPESQSVQVRIQQLVLLYQFIEKHMKRHMDEPCFVMGDFNVDGIRQTDKRNVLYADGDEPPLPPSIKSSHLNEETIDVQNEKIIANNTILNMDDNNEKLHSREYLALISILQGDFDSIPNEYKPVNVPDMPVNLKSYESVEEGASFSTFSKPKFQITDIIYNYYSPQDKKHPITTSNFRGWDKPYERKSLDYIFELQGIDDSHSTTNIINNESTLTPASAIAAALPVVIPSAQKYCPILNQQSTTSSSTFSPNTLTTTTIPSVMATGEGMTKTTSMNSEEVTEDVGEEESCENTPVLQQLDEIGYLGDTFICPRPEDEDFIAIGNLEHRPPQATMLINPSTAAVLVARDKEVESFVLPDSATINTVTGQPSASVTVTPVDPLESDLKTTNGGFSSSTSMNATSHQLKKRGGSNNNGHKNSCPSHLRDDSGLLPSSTLSKLQSFKSQQSINILNADVMEYEVKNNPNFKYISDHYGVTTTINI